VQRGSFDLKRSSDDDEEVYASSEACERSEPSDEDIDEVVRKLNGICRASSLEFALRVGAVIIHGFYGGDTKAWRDRGPKVHSFRRLTQHPELALSAGALYRCVAVFELCDRLNAPTKWRRLGASHLAAVIGLAPDDQVRFLSAANDERWTVRVLRDKVEAVKGSRSRGGRIPNSFLERRLREVHNCTRNCLDALDQVEHAARVLPGSPLLELVTSSLENLLQQLRYRAQSSISASIGDRLLAEVPDAKGR
jgi:hypothetical protein